MIGRIETKQWLSLLMAVLMAGSHWSQLNSPFDRRPDLRKSAMNFVDVTDQFVLPTVNEQNNNEKHVEFGDIDNDGDLDVAIAVALSDFTSRRNKLYRNDNGFLMEISGSPAIPGFSIPDVARNAFLRDYDHDGWLDLIIVNDSNNGPTAGTTRYFANKHPGEVFSHFEDETDRLDGAGGAACSAEVADFNSDGNIDLWVGNYPFNSQDVLALNGGIGIFTDVTNTNVPNDNDYTVDIAVADMNADEKLDILISNHFAPNYIYYNDNNSAGGGEGNFNYSSSKQTMANGNLESAMEPADFNRDGKLDIYVCNRGGAGNNRRDVVLVNQGNDGNNRATFSEVTMPGSVSNNETKKATVADFNNDGRPDVIVMAEGRRPVILRNTSAGGGETSFVEWTPAPAFPTGSTLAGWHAGAADINQDGRMDLLIGGTNGDHLMHGADSNFQKETSLNSVLPNLHNSTPVGILGTGAKGARDAFSTTNIPSGASVSVVVKSRADTVLEVRNGNGDLLHSSDRGSEKVEEVLQFTAPGGVLSFEVIVNGSSQQYFLEILSRNG